MGWGSGSRVMTGIIEGFMDNGGLLFADREIAYRSIIQEFESNDCDTLNECLGLDPAFDLVYNELNPPEVDETADILGPFANIQITEYLHRSDDEFADWEMELGKRYRDSDAATYLGGRLYEVEFDLDINPNTGKYKILEVRDGEQRLVPAED